MRQIKAVLDDPGLGDADQAARLIDRVHALGLRPFVPPKPLDPIREDDVMLVCWMGVREP